VSAPNTKPLGIEAHLLASALVGQVKLWTTDPRLTMLVKELGIGF
jgi:hypothetical protein